MTPTTQAVAAAGGGDAAHLARCPNEAARTFLSLYLARIAATPGADAVIGETLDGAEHAARGLLSERREMTRVDCILITPDVDTHPEILAWRVFADGHRSGFVPMWFAEGEDLAGWARDVDEYMEVNRET